MQRSLSLPQRLFMQSLVSAKPCDIFSLRPIALRSVSNWAGRILQESAAHVSFARFSIPLREKLSRPPTPLLQEMSIQPPHSAATATATATEVAGITGMRQYISAAAISCRRGADLTPVVLSSRVPAPSSAPARVLPGKFWTHLSLTSIPKPDHRHSGLRWVSSQHQQEYPRKQLVRIDAGHGFQNLLTMKQLRKESKRGVYEDDSVTTSSSSDVSSPSEDDEDSGGLDGTAHTEDEDSTNDMDDELADDVEKELEDSDDGDDFWDEDEDGDILIGDGGYGGGVVLGGTEWGKRALDLAELVVAEAGRDLSIFAFKVSPDGVIRVRLDKLSDRYGSPTMKDIERFSRKYRSILEEDGAPGPFPEDFEVEVSSPGAERVVRIPDDLNRFKELPMYVRYLEGDGQNIVEKDGVLELESLDLGTGVSVWKIADVKLNREVKGKGRPLNSKQRKWRAELPLTALKQVRLYLEV